VIDVAGQPPPLSLTTVTAAKPRLCPHGKVWLIGAQWCGCADG